MGVSMLVDAINSRRPSGATENTVLGPFYIEGASVMEFGDNICLDMKGQPMVVNGQVTDVDGNPLEGVKLERNNRLPAHLHFIIRAEGYQEVTTYIFVPDDPHINDDAVFGVKESLLRDSMQIDDAAKAAEYGVANPFYEVVFNVVLAQAND